MIKIIVMVMAFFGAAYFIGKIAAAHQVAFTLFGVGISYVMCGAVLTALAASQLKSK